jgi:23S rRNA (adenine2503-C2)-methyltransferase
LKLSQLHQRLRDLDAKPVHERRFLRQWSHAQPPAQGRPADFYPQRLRDALPALEAELESLARLDSQHPGEDGVRLLVQLADGQTVESVLLPRGDRKSTRLNSSHNPASRMPSSA